MVEATPIYMASNKSIYKNMERKHLVIEMLPSFEEASKMQHLMRTANPTYTSIVILDIIS
jgi:hypothetical protein